MQGCALVHYATPEESARAVATLVESELKGRKILVREDREPEGGPVPGSRPAVPRGGYGGAPRGGFGGAGGGGGGGGFIPRGGAGGGGFRGAPRAGFGGGLDGAGPARPDFVPGTSLYVGNVSGPPSRHGCGAGWLSRGCTHPPPPHHHPHPHHYRARCPQLSWEVTWRDLKDSFASFGVTYADVKMGPDGRSKGFGIVRFATPADAARAIEAMNGVDLKGRNIIVREDAGPRRAIA
jgi:RNA recognition motif-containing protein